MTSFDPTLTLQLDQTELKLASKRLPDQHPEQPISTITIPFQLHNAVFQ